MAVSILTNKDRATGNGVTDAFNFTFVTFNNSSVEVYVIDNLTDIQVLKTEGVEYNLVRNSDNIGGTATFTGGNIPTSDEDVLIRRVTPKTQTTSFGTESNFPETALETAYDKLTLIIQDICEKVDRGIFYDLDSTTTDKVLLEPVAETVIGYDGSLNLKNFTPTELFGLASGALLVLSNLSDLNSVPAALSNLGIGPFEKQNATFTINDLEAGPTPITGWTLDSALFKSAIYWIEVERGARFATDMIVAQFVSGAWRLEKGPKIGDNSGLTLTPSGTTVLQVNYASNNFGAGTLKFKGMKYNV